MSDAGPGSQSLTNFPPGSLAPTAAARAAEREARLRDPDHLARMNAGRAAWLEKPKEERDRVTAERKAARAAKEAAREEKRAAKRRARGVAPDSAPATVRSQPSPVTTTPPPPDSDVPRRGAVGGALRGLLDLVQVMPGLGDGSCFIQVNRLKPTVSFSVPCAGIQQPIWEAIDDAAFQAIYGGGKFSLRGYKLTDDNRSRAMTEPVAYEVPGAPNLDALLNEEDTTMRPNGGAHGHPVTALPLRGRPSMVTPQAAAAEAQIHDRNLEHQETMDDRQERRRVDREERRAADERAQRQEQTSVARILAESKDKEAERLKEVYDRQLESRGGGLTDMVEIMKVMRPGEETAALSRQHASEIKQISDGHKSEVIRLTEQHRTELQRLTESHGAALQRVEDHARDERKRSDELVREAERRSNETIREAQRASDQRVTDVQNASRVTYEDLKSRGEERLKDQNEQWTRRFDDLKTAHDRELRAKESEIIMMRTNLEGNQQVILATKDAENKRLSHELRIAKDEAEKNKDWVGQAEKFEKQAEAMGYAKGGDAPEEDFKTTIAKAAISQIHKIPDMIKSGADAISAIRNPGVPPDVARSQARAGMTRASMRTLPRTMHGPNPVQLTAPLVFATEDTDYVPPPGELPAMPRFAPQQHGPMFDPAPPEQQGPPPGYYQQQAPAAAQQQAPVPAPEGPPALAAAPPTDPAAPPAADAALSAPAQSIAPPAGAAVPSPAAPSDISPTVVAAIAEWAPNLAAAFNGNAAPEEVAQAILAQAQGAPPEMVRSMFAGITIDQVIRFIVQNPGEHGVLATRNGQKFLRNIWMNIDKTINAPGVA